MTQPPGNQPRRPSVKDVATRAGVSLGTVSNVMNRPHLVSDETRSRVDQAMSDLGFVRNESARQLRAGRSKIIGYVMLDGANPFFTDVARGIESVVEERDLALFLCNSDNRPARESVHLANLLEQQVQGILVTPVDPDSGSLADLALRDTPLVLVDRTQSGADFCSVSVDDVLGGRLAVEHLVDRGHRRVAFVGDPDSLGQVRERYTGAREAWREAGRPADDLLLLPTRELSVGEGRAAGERIAGLPAARRPTAAFCSNDLVALGLLQHATSARIRVPDDLAILGFDDIEFAAAAAVPLSSVRQPRAELGRTAARLLLAEVDDPAHVHEQIVFRPELVARGSTLGRPPRDEGLHDRARN